MLHPDTKAAAADIVVLDFEATGVTGVLPDEPWQLGMVRVCSGRIDVSTPYESLLRVGDRPFSPYAPGRHAAVRGELALAPTLPELWPDLRPWWTDAALAAHNAATEQKFIRQAFPLHKPGPWIDTLKLVRIAYPDLASHKLENLLDALELTGAVREICPDREPHDALFDATACATLLVHLLDLDGWEDATIAALAAARPDAFYRRR
jgi:DNA polymerase III epsilon subunit-like protein